MLTKKYSMDFQISTIILSDFDLNIRFHNPISVFERLQGK